MTQGGNSVRGKMACTKGFSKAKKYRCKSPSFIASVRFLKKAAHKKQRRSWNWDSPMRASERDIV